MRVVFAIFALVTLFACGDDASPLQQLSSIEVTPGHPSIAAGTAVKLTAIAMYSDASSRDVTGEATWSSDAPEIVTVDGGSVQSHAPGSATITATFEAVTATATVTVTDVALVSIEVTPTNATVPNGLDRQFAATGVFSDATTQDLTAQVTWTSTVAGVATIDAMGLASGVALGSTTIGARVGFVIGTTTLMVTAGSIASIAIAPVDSSIPKGVPQPFTATATLSDATTMDVTTQVDWTSSDPSIATIAPTGIATTLATGSTTITAMIAGASASTSLSVTAATLQSIAVAPPTPSIANGLTQQFVATGTYSDGSTPDITTSVTWVSSVPSIATISNVAGSRGLATAMMAGQVTISAALDGTLGTSHLTVTNANLLSIAVAPTNSTMTKDSTRQFTAIGTYTDGSMPDLTDQVTWMSSDATLVAISNASGSWGLATAVDTGNVTISATLTGTTGSTSLAVILPTPGLVRTSPADGATAVRPAASISIVFAYGMDPATITAQPANGPCSGSIQLSQNDFASCVGLGAIAMSSGNAVATTIPLLTMTPFATYKLRVLSTIRDAYGTQLPSTIVHATGFTIATDGPCGAHVMISQLYWGGNNTLGVYQGDYVELHNPAPFAQSIAGMSLQSTAAGGWRVIPLPAVSIAAGGYYLVRTIYGSHGTPLVADYDASANGFDIGGQVALVATTIALTGNCPIADTIDFVGYGNACGTESAPYGDMTAAALRFDGGCRDTSVNDFYTSGPQPHNTMSAPKVCACSATETTSVAELDYCNLQFPSTMTVPAGMSTPIIYGRAFEAGLTETAGPSSKITAAVGYGPTNFDPSMYEGWTWSPATFNVQVGNDEEYQGSFIAPASGTYAFATRFTRDAVNWSYCDLNGAGANAGLVFETSQLGVLTVP